MSSLPIDIRSRGALANDLTQLFLFVEDVNRACYAAVRESLSRRHLLPSAVVSTRKAWLSEKFPYSPTDLQLQLARAGISRRPRPELIDAFARRLLYPAIPVDVEKDWRFEGGTQQKAGLPGVPSPFSIWTKIHLYRPDRELQFSTRALNGVGDSIGTVQGAPPVFWDEPLDPMRAIRDFLIQDHDVREHEVNWYLQKWLRREFRIRYDRPFKYAIASTARRFNEVFFGHRSPSQQVLSTGRPCTVSLGLLLREIDVILRAQTTVDPDTRLRSVLGVYLFLRFCHIVRCRYHFPDSGHETGTDLFGEFRDEVVDRQCVSALRGLEYNHFQTRVFGALTSVPGLNAIFRGGLLAQTERGRSFVVQGPPGAGKSGLSMQLMADLACQGGLAVYFSFEESFDQLLDRLVAFDLQDREAMTVEEAITEEQITEKVRAWSASSDDRRKGMLLLVGGRPGERYSLVERIRLVGEAALTERWRGLVVDSVNALQFPPPDQVSSRETLRHVVEAIEEARFFGILISEEDGGDLKTQLPYLADTVAFLGADGAARRRWIEIRKSRTQDVHHGPHQLRISGSKGVQVYPSIQALTSMLRTRSRGMLSQHRGIPLGLGLETDVVQEKSSSLISGPHGLASLLFLLNLVTRPSQSKQGMQVQPSESDEPPLGVLIVSFREPSARFLQILGEYPTLKNEWNRIVEPTIRWFSPGSNMTAEQVIGELWLQIQRARRRGVPIERIVFHRVDVAGQSLPALRDEPLFWPLLLELASTQALTSFFLAECQKPERTPIGEHGVGVDYMFHVRPEPGENGQYELDVRKAPGLLSRDTVSLRFDKDGTMKPAGVS